MVIIAEKKDFDISKHILVPKHTKLTEKEKEALLEKYKITPKELPKISMKDPAVSGMDLKVDDIIKIERQSPTASTTVFFRRVVK